MKNAALPVLLIAALVLLGQPASALKTRKEMADLSRLAGRIYRRQQQMRKIAFRSICSIRNEPGEWRFVDDNVCEGGDDESNCKRFLDDEDACRNAPCKGGGCARNGNRDVCRMKYGQKATGRPESGIAAAAEAAKICKDREFFGHHLKPGDDHDEDIDDDKCVHGQVRSTAAVTEASLSTCTGTKPATWPLCGYSPDECVRSCSCSTTTRAPGTRCDGPTLFASQEQDCPYKCTAKAAFKPWENNMAYATNEATVRIGSDNNKKLCDLGVWSPTNRGNMTLFTRNGTDAVFVNVTNEAGAGNALLMQGEGNIGLFRGTNNGVGPIDIETTGDVDVAHLENLKGEVDFRHARNLVIVNTNNHKRGVVNIDDTAASVLRATNYGQLTLTRSSCNILDSKNMGGTVTVDTTGVQGACALRATVNTGRVEVRGGVVELEVCDNTGGTIDMTKAAAGSTLRITGGSGKKGTVVPAGFQVLTAASGPDAPKCQRQKIRTSAVKLKGITQSTFTSVVQFAFRKAWARKCRVDVARVKLLNIRDSSNRRLQQLQPERRKLASGSIQFDVEVETDSEEEAAEVRSAISDPETNTDFVGDVLVSFKDEVAEVKASKECGGLEDCSIAAATVAALSNVQVEVATDSTVAGGSDPSDPGSSNPEGSINVVHVAVGAACGALVVVGFIFVAYKRRQSAPKPVANSRSSSSGSNDKVAQTGKSEPGDEVPYAV